MGFSKLWMIFFSLLCSGCAILAPRVIPQDRPAYNNALKLTDEKQLLLNMVRMQYSDSPYFVSVSSITASTSFSSGINANFLDSTTQQRFASPPNTRNLDKLSSLSPTRILLDSTGINPNVNYQETPTVTYTPLQGSTFTTQMLVPISLEKMILLIESGWSAARVLRLTVQSVGNLRNAPGSTRPGTSHIPEYKPFMEFAHFLRALERENILSFHALPKIKGRPFTVEVVLTKHTPYARQNMQKLLRMLGFKHWHNKFYLVESDRGIVDEAAQRVTIQGRSYLGVLYYLSKSVQVRKSDVVRGVVIVPRYENGEYFNWGDVTQGMMKIHMSAQKPSDPNDISVYYRGMWFYIEDTDSDSKETLSLLQQLFSLQAGDLKGNPPSLTLPI